MTVARWHDWEGQGLEHCVCLENGDGLSLEGVVAGTRHGTYGGHYFVRTDAAFRTREVRLEYVDGPSLHVEADEHGNWRDIIGNRSLPTLDGCFDVDIGITPATNTLPIKRLNLRDEERREIAVAYVPLPDQVAGDFLPQRAEQRYTCITRGHRYRYEGLFRGFTADLVIDDFGLVLDYPDTFRRVL
ncbi:putative glycolipid-binding domain-containing protein [Roseobacter sp. YSTF-M11]|uniref:Glycolipid-binding domain-containing protein n=1 Tax=Roseobacter insulae TaxID=2859783 RepID=A0A9X1FXE4_9RHOB|nr:putative glycolipid-binding domain-containing protein [Roseobacter insulae]MBW4708790.1 putative glycolipid-binding domain-containing protein [Roseobacter insulae]